MAVEEPARSDAPGEAVEEEALTEVEIGALRAALDQDLAGQAGPTPSRLRMWITLVTLLLIAFGLGVVWMAILERG